MFEEHSGLLFLPEWLPYTLSLKTMSVYSVFKFVSIRVFIVFSYVYHVSYCLYFNQFSLSYAFSIMILWLLSLFLKYFQWKIVYFLSLFKEPTFIFNDPLYFIFILDFINFSLYLYYFLPTFLEFILCSVTNFLN